MPVVATLVGVLLLGEHLRWNEPVGALIVLTGVAVSQGVPAMVRRRYSTSRSVPVSTS
jgi:threonine/homoserine efflux transporter RhtA